MGAPPRELVTGRRSHEIFVLEDGRKRWVPDLWTMREEGLSPENLRIVADDELDQLESGDPVRSAVPAPRLDDGTYVESEGRIFTVENGRLRRIAPDEARLLPTRKDFANPDGTFNRNAFDARVVYLPASVIRSLLEESTP